MKLYYEALKKLPDKFIHNGTKACLYDGTRVIAVNPEHPPIVYSKDTEKWIKLELTNDPSAWPLQRNDGVFGGTGKERFF